MTDEDRLLLANRERLLARSDWLGLAASRPAHMTFPISSDRGKVGKRRKMHRSTKSHKAKAARPRSITPLHEHRLPPFEPMMSGAVMEEAIQVKIGTDALVSQSQYSHPAQPSANTSMRQPSTEFGPLSEESMLLGVDDDGFEIDANGEYLGAIGKAGTLVDGSDYQRPPSNSQWTDDFTVPTRLIASTFATTTRGVSPHDQNEYPQYQTVPAVQLRHDQIAEETADDRRGWDQTGADPEDQRNVSDEMDAEEDERRWRRAMRIPERISPSDSSLVGLRSSSQHVTQSTASAWPTQVDRGAHKEYVEREFGDEPTNDLYPVTFGHQSARPTDNEAFKMNTTTAHSMPSHPASKQALTTEMKPDGQDQDDEALWRNFILGKRESDSVSASSEPENNVLTTEQDEAAGHAFRSTSSKAGTDPARSDKVTVGDSAFVTERRSDDEEPHDTRQAENKAIQGYATTSMVGHATTANFEDDEIDELYPDDSVSRAAGNVHGATTTSILNPRRFRRQRRQEFTQNVENPHRFKVRTAERSVW